MRLIKLMILTATCALITGCSGGKKGSMNGDDSTRPSRYKKTYNSGRAAQNNLR